MMNTIGVRPSANDATKPSASEIDEPTLPYAVPNSAFAPRTRSSPGVCRSAIYQSTLRCGCLRLLLRSPVPGFLAGFGAWTLVGGRSSQDNPAGRLADDVLRDRPDVVLERAAGATEQRPPAHPRRLLGAEHHRLNPPAPRLVDDRLPGPAGPDDRGGDLDALVLLAHQLGPRQCLARPSDL